MLRYWRKFRMGLGGQLLDVVTPPVLRIEQKLDAMEYHSHGGRATYIGNNRLLVKVVVAGANIAYLVEADDLLITPWFAATGTYEIDLTNFFLKQIKIDSHCLDVGSNFGFFACLFARFAPRGRIVAIEADKHVCALCRDNLGVNGFTEIATAMHAAANDTGAPLTLYRRNGRSGNTSVIAADRSFTDMLGEEPAVPFTVQGVRLDDLLSQFGGRVDFLKIDVEGAEPAALRGAQRIIATNPQLNIVMEWSPGQLVAGGTDPGSFLDELGGMGLLFFDINTRQRLSRDDVLGSSYKAGLLMSQRV